MRAKRWREWLLVALFSLISLWFASLIWGLSGKAKIAVQQARQAEKGYTELEARKAALGATIEASQTPRGKDAAIRTAFGVARQGEEVIVVVPPAVPTTTPPLPWWKRVLNWF